MSTVDDVVPVILAGGRGMRLRPLTSDSSPKPFLRLFSKYSLFQETVLRVSDFHAPIIVTHHDYLPYVQEQFAEIGVVAHSIILEPDHKGTAAAIAMAAFSLKNQGKVMLVMPSDHVMAGDCSGVLSSCVEASFPQADQNIVMCGVRPTRAETGYGYITYEDGGEGEKLHSVFRFIEKPIHTKAQALIKQGKCLWNTGIFLARPKTYLELLKRYERDTYKYTERAFYAGEDAGGVYYPVEDDFMKIEPVSVDYAVMEHCDTAYVVEVPLFWCDVGTWSQVFRLKVGRFFKRVNLSDSQLPNAKRAS